MIICPVGVGLGDVMSPAIYFFNPTPTPMGSPMLKDPQPTACRSPSCSLMTTTGSSQA